MKPTSRLQQKIIFDAAMILGAVGLLALSIAAQERAAPGRQAIPSVFLGFYIIYLGVLFLLSYFYSHASYVLSALMWTCEHFSHPRGRFMALFYFGLSLVVGVCALLAAFGVL